MYRVKPLDPAVIEYVRSAAAEPARLADLQRMLIELVNLDTATSADPGLMAEHEAALFEWLGREAAAADPTARAERLPIHPAIADDPEYTLPSYAAGPDGLPPSFQAVYGGRANLVISVPGDAPGGRGLVCHAHIDVVPPWFPARLEGSRLYGRGACDNKAQVALLLAQMRLLAEVRERFGAQLPPMAYQFAIDEEIGGNGSLSLAKDPRFAGWPVLITECTDLVPYCAHRGAVYYRIRLDTRSCPQLSAVELFPWVVLALEREGRLIREQSVAPMFGPEQVQTCHGTLDGFGHSPGSVCDHVAVEARVKARFNAERMAMKMGELMDLALGEYIKVYGDKSREPDPATGRAKVERHFEVRSEPGPRFHHFRIDVFGKGGHMGSVPECDNAITKAAYLLAALLKAAASYPMVQVQARPAAGAPGEALAEVAWGDSDHLELVLTGGQGFTPAHGMDELRSRMTAAATGAVQECCRQRRVSFESGLVQVSFQALHNDACAGSPENAPMQALKAAFEAIGRPWPQIKAWSTSCDARLYHKRGHEVAILGAGKLEPAHSPDEYIDLPDLQPALAVLALYPLSLC